MKKIIATSAVALLILLSPFSVHGASTRTVDASILQWKGLASTTNPAAGYFRGYLDSADSTPKVRDSSGNVRSYLMDFGAQTAAGVKTWSNTPLFKDSIELEDDDGGTNKVKMKVGNAIASDYTITLPATVCASGEVWKDNGSGVLSCSSDNTGGGGGSFAPTNSTSITATGACTYTVDADLIGNKIGVFVLSAGGGGGTSNQAANGGGGGGGGTWVYKELYAEPGMVFNCWIGSGGAGGTGTGGPGSPGQNSIFGPLVVLGGSGGNGYGFPATARGNSGGTTQDQPPNPFSYSTAAGASATVTAPTGMGFFTSAAYGGGGVGSASGGAGSGENGLVGGAAGGTGGAGAIFTDPITSTPTNYGGGGGGATWTGTSSTGGAGGGGFCTMPAGTGSAGTANTGGGGGGASAGNGGDGGSGLIIVYWEE